MPLNPETERLVSDVIGQMPLFPDGGPLPSITLPPPCPHCGECEPLDGMHTADSEHSHDHACCGDCADMHPCDGCGHDTADDELHTAYDGEHCRPNMSPQEVCEGCFDRCGDCGGRFYGMSARNPSDELVCGQCAESYTSCDSCGTVISFDDAYSSEDGDGCYCEACRPASGEHIHDYSYRPHAKFHGHSPVGLYFGVELEVDDGDDDADETAGECTDAARGLIYCKSDGSLHDGFEMVSHPATWEYWRDCECKHMAKAKAGGFGSYDRDTCGMHVHISRKALTKLDIFKLVTFFADNESFIQKAARRNTDRWAKITKDDAHVKARGGEGNERYEAINTCNAKTIEIRIFRGTLKVSSMKRNLAFVRTMIAFVKECSTRDLTESKYLVYLRENAADILGNAEMAASLVSWLNARESEEEEE